MKLWLLQPRDDLKLNDNPWNPWYEKAFGFVVRAETEAEARDFANKSSGEESRFFPAWLDSNYSTCVELTEEGDAGVVICDFARS